MEFGNPVIGQEELIRSAIKSKNYASGVSGWRIAANGTAEFTGLIINSSGVQGYITIANGEIVVRRASDNEIIAKMTSLDNPGFITRDADDPRHRYAAMTSRYLRFSSEAADPAGQDPGLLMWDEDGVISYLTIQSGSAQPGLTVANIFVTSSADGDPDARSHTTFSSNNGLANDVYIGGHLKVQNSGPGMADLSSIFIDGTDIGRGMRDFATLTTNTATTTTTETVGFSSGSTLFPAGRAFKVQVKGIVTSTVAADVARVRVRRGGGITGTVLIDTRSLVIPAAGSSQVFDFSTVIRNNTAGDITDTFSVTFVRFSGTGNVNMEATSNLFSFISIEDIGPASGFPGAYQIT